MRWIEVAVDTSTAAEEAVANILMEAGCGGVAISDPSAFVLNDAPQARFPLMEESRGGGVVYVTGYFPMDDSLEERLSRIKERIDNLSAFGLDVALGDITIRGVDEEDWATAWKAFFKPLKVGNIVVKPSWEDYSPSEGDVMVRVDPGMAFGTGTHPTTQLCLLALQKYTSSDDDALDLGCGSGILAMAAAKLGARSVVAVDIDPVAVEAAQKNVEAEGLDDKIGVELGDGPPAGRQFDLVAANIVANTIIELGGRVKGALRLDGILISSGIVSDRELDVRSKLESIGLETVEVMRDGDWVTFVSRRVVDG